MAPLTVSSRATDEALFVYQSKGLATVCLSRTVGGWIFRIGEGVREGMWKS